MSRKKKKKRTGDEPGEQNRQETDAQTTAPGSAPGSDPDNDTDNDTANDGETVDEVDAIDVIDALQKQLEEAHQVIAEQTAEIERLGALAAAKPRAPEGRPTAYRAKRDIVEAGRVCKRGETIELTPERATKIGPRFVEKI